VQGNSIGTDPNGTLHLGNLWNGVFAAGKNTVIGGPAPGAPNLIAYNSRAGVLVSGSGVTVSANSIWGNNGLGIDLAPAGVTANDAGDLDAGANGLQNFPLLSSVTAGSGDVTVAGSIDTTASTSFTIEFFASPSCDASGNGEGQYFLGSLPVTTGPAGSKVFSATLTSVSGADQITATATGPSGTSEFSACAT
jgi:hypothetical protein